MTLTLVNRFQDQQLYQRKMLSGNKKLDIFHQKYTGMDIIWNS